jgi:hypothetical protein
MHEKLVEEDITLNRILDKQIIHSSAETSASIKKNNFFKEISSKEINRFVMH